MRSVFKKFSDKLGVYIARLSEWSEKYKMTRFVSHWIKQYWALPFLVVLVSPWIAEKLLEIIGWKWFGNISASDWMIYFAAISGAYATLVAVVYTVRDSSARDRMKQEENDMPYLFASVEKLDISQVDLAFNADNNVILCGSRDWKKLDPVPGRITLSNLGLGAAINVKYEQPVETDGVMKPSSVLPAKSNDHIDFIVGPNKSDKIPVDYHFKELYFYCESMRGARFMLIVGLSVFVGESPGAVGFIVREQSFVQLDRKQNNE